MANRWLLKSSFFIFSPLMLALLFVAACGGSAAPAETAPQAVEPTATKGVIFKPTAAPLAEAKKAAEPAAVVPSMAAGEPIYGGVPPMHAYSAPDHWGTHRSGTLNQIMHSSPVYNNLVMFDPETYDRDDIIGGWALVSL